MENQTQNSNKGRTNLDHCKNSPGFKDFANHLDALPKGHFLNALIKASKNNWFPNNEKRRAWLKLVKDNIWNEDQPNNVIVTETKPNRKTRRLSLQKIKR